MNEQKTPSESRPKCEQNKRQDEQSRRSAMVEEMEN